MAIPGQEYHPPCSGQKKRDNRETSDKHYTKKNETSNLPVAQHTCSPDKCSGTNLYRTVMKAEVSVSVWERRKSQTGRRAGAEQIDKESLTFVERERDRVKKRER